MARIRKKVLSPVENKPLGKKASPRNATVDLPTVAVDLPAAESLDPVTQVICERVKELRHRKGWTLEQLATLSGVSRSMLSQIERGAANPTLVVGWRIAAAFGMSLGELVELPTQRNNIDIVRGSDAQAVFRDDSACRIRTLSPLQCEKDVEFYHLTLKPGGVLESAPHFDGTREFLTIETGAAHVTAGAQQEQLAAGDSAHYAADLPHRIANPTDQFTEAFLVVIYASTKAKRGSSTPRKGEIAE